MPDFYKDFPAFLYEKKSPVTANKYIYYLRRWKKMFPNQPFEKTFTKDNLNKFLMPKGNDNQPCRSALKKSKEYILTHWPDDNEDVLRIGRTLVPKSERIIRHKVKTTCTEEEFKTILYNLPSMQLRVATIIMFYSGTRIGETMKLRKRDFNFDSWDDNKECRGILTIPPEIAKKGAGRKTSIPPTIMNYIYGYCKPLKKEDLLFNFSQEHLGNNLRKISREKLGKNIHPHSLRRSFAMNLQEEGLALDAIQLFLGHKNISTTQLYAKKTFRQAVKELENVYGSKPYNKRELENNPVKKIPQPEVKPKQTLEEYRAKQRQMRVEIQDELEQEAVEEELEIEEPTPPTPPQEPEETAEEKWDRLQKEYEEEQDEEARKKGYRDRFDMMEHEDDEQ